MSGLFEAYLAGTVPDFYAGDWTSAENRRSAVRRAVRPVAPDVGAALAAQNARLAPSDARVRHVGALRRGAAAVVTGQQMGLFLGPLFTLYKAATAVRAARALEAETGETVVPVFWLQTEDHDLPEIAACGVPRADDAPLHLRVPASPDDRVSIAHRTLPAEVEACLGQLDAELGRLPHAEAHLARLARHYRPGAGWAEAFAGLLGEVFADEGLVLLDPRDPALAAAAAPVHRRALAAARPLAEALLARGRALEAAGFAPTVHVRPGAPLSFFHPDGPAGPRFRLAPAAGGFAEVGGLRVHDAGALSAALAAAPRRFSTSVLLRPILQDTWLPTAAYVGGPAEVAYFAQLAPLYAAFDLAMPLVAPRARVCVVDEKAARVLARLGLGADAAAREEDDLLATAQATEPAQSGAADLGATLLAPFTQALAEVGPRLAALDADLTAAVAKTRAAVETAVARLGARYERALLRRDQALVEDVRRLRRSLQPGGQPQERCVGLPYFAARFGEREFVARVLDAVAPFDPAPVTLAWPAPPRAGAVATGGAG